MAVYSNLSLPLLPSGPGGVRKISLRRSQHETVHYSKLILIVQLKIFCGLFCMLESLIFLDHRGFLAIIPRVSRCHPRGGGDGDLAIIEVLLVPRFRGDYRKKLR